MCDKSRSLSNVPPLRRATCLTRRLDHLQLQRARKARNDCNKNAALKVGASDLHNVAAEITLSVDSWRHQARRSLVSPPQHSAHGDCTLVPMTHTQGHDE